MRQKTSCEAHGATWSPSAHLWREQVTVERKLPTKRQKRTSMWNGPREGGRPRRLRDAGAPPAPRPSGEGRADPPWLAMMVSRL